MPFGNVAGFTVMAALMVTLYARAPVAPRPSVAVIVKFDVAAVVGVPVIAPLLRSATVLPANCPQLR